MTKIKRTHKPVVVVVCLGPVSKTKRVRDFELICGDSLKYMYKERLTLLLTHYILIIIVSADTTQARHYFLTSRGSQ